MNKFMETKKEVELKLWTMIIRPKNVVVNMPEQVRLLLAFDEAEALRTTFKDCPETSIKATGFFTIEQIRKNLGGLFEQEVVREPLDLSKMQDFSNIQVKEIITQSEEIAQSKVEGIGEKLKNLLQYLLQDDNAFEDRRKLTKTDLNNLKNIIKKL